MDQPIKPGTIAGIHSLQSATGRKMNGTRALVLRFHQDVNRWEVRLEDEEEEGATKAIKEGNLRPLQRLPLPKGPRRGLAHPDDMDTLVTKLCELLLYYKDDFRPSEIMFVGYAAMAFMRMDQSNFMHFYPIQMEQMGAVLALANVCLQAEEGGAERVVFGLLEGNEMYVDVLLQTIYWTGYIVEDGQGDDEYYDGFCNCPPTKLTPDQDSIPYIKTMQEGPVLLLECVTKYCFAPALWNAMARSEFYHLLIQRLLRWVAREAKKTSDGVVLGKKARKILSSMFPEIAVNLKQPISDNNSDSILQGAKDKVSEPNDVTIDNLKDLLLSGA